MGLTREELIEKLIDMDRLLLSDLQWTQKAGARNSEGEVINPMHADAVCWCLTGAAYKVCDANQGHYTQVAMALKATMNQTQLTISEFNDQTTFPKMKEILHKAREIARTEEPWTATFPDRLK